MIRHSVDRIQFRSSPQVLADIDMSNISSYDQTCAEEFQAAMKDYFDGNTKDYDTALQTFIDKVKTKHPEIEG